MVPRYILICFLYLDSLPFARSLLADVTYFHQCTYSHNTKKSHRTFQRTYFAFCNHLNLPPVPAGTTHLCMYAAYLARFLLPQSVCVYLNYVGLLHKQLGFPNPLHDNWAVSAVVKGIRRVFGVPYKPRLPMTTSILAKIYSRLNLSLSRHASFWAICLVSFFGLFRKQHLLPESQSQFDPTKQFTRADIRRTTYGYLLKVRWSKTIQLGQRTVDVPLIAIPGSVLCPVRAVTHAFLLAPLAGPLSQAFCFQTNSFQVSCFTYRIFMGMLKEFIKEIGLAPNDYGTHSFRRGGASFALEAGVSLESISILGDWKSDAMYLYLQVPLSQRLSAQRCMASHLTSHLGLPNT